MRPLLLSIALLFAAPAIAGEFHDGAAMLLATNAACDEQVFSHEEVGMAIFLAAAEANQEVATASLMAAAEAAILLRDAGNNALFCIIARDELDR